MSYRVLIIPDKFKGTLTASAAAEAIAKGWRRARPRDAIEMVPMCDGGDGFGQVMSALLGARPRRIETIDAARRPCHATWWWSPGRKTAIIESANVIGLAMLPPGKLHPFELDTAGLGAVFDAAQAKGARRILVGLGGSATNDGGFGVARALGWEFLDRSKKAIERWIDLPALAEVRPPKSRVFGEVTLAVDVRNPLLGPTGASRIYGPQKGLRGADFARAERCLGRLARVVKRQFGQDYARTPGSGAAGGLAFGLLAFTRGRIRPGFELFAEMAALERRLRVADLVITGEGALDDSTHMGKGVGQIARRCRELKIPCIALAGTMKRSRQVSRPFSRVCALTDVTTLKEAKARPAYWLETLSAGIGKAISGFHPGHLAQKEGQGRMVQLAVAARHQGVHLRGHQS